MDIYNFIENEEQREYLLNKHYEFTAVEAAYVVCNSNRAIKEKHDAIDYIINNYEDCEMVKECQTEYSSTLDCIFRSSGKLIPLKTVSPFPDVR